VSISRSVTDAVESFAALARKWAALVSGSFSVPITIAGFLTERDYQQAIWWNMAAAALIFSYYLDHKKQTGRIKELEARLSPKIRLFLRPDPTGQTTGIEIAKSDVGEELPHVQVCVEPLTSATIYDPVPNITKIEHRPDKSVTFLEVYGESRRIDWPHHSTGATLSKGKPLRFNIVWYHENTNTLYDVVEKYPNKLSEFYSSVGKKGEYRYTVHVEGRDAMPAMAHVYVEWRRSKYPLVTLEPLEAAQA
jgi:hypothetical protein